jgi:DNA-binding NarL/FixJ family response regulator
VRSCWRSPAPTRQSRAFLASLGVAREVQQQPDTAFIEPQALRVLQQHRLYLHPGSTHTLYGQATARGGFLMKLRVPSNLDSLSPRERQIAELYARGSSYKQLAERLELVSATVRNHLQNIYAKLRVTNRDSLITMLEG